jgi:hypothetical protein
MNRLFSLFFLVVGVSVAQAQSGPNVGVKPFTTLKLQGCLTAQLVRGERPGVQITAPAAESENIVVESTEGKLVIKQKVAKTLFNDGKCDPDRVRVTLSYQTLASLSASMGALVKADAPIETRDLDLSAHSGSDVRVDVAVENLKVAVAEGSRVRIAGRAADLQSHVTTGAELQAYDLQSEDVFIKSNTGASAQVTALKRIDATAGTGGSISYKGRPERRDENTNLGGEIYRRN